MEVGVQYTTYDIEITYGDDLIYVISKIYNAIETCARKYGAFYIYMRYDEREQKIYTQIKRAFPNFKGSMYETMELPLKAGISEWAYMDALFLNMKERGLFNLDNAPSDFSPFSNQKASQSEV